MDELSQPDKDIENFWISFKCAISNFYRVYDINKSVKNFSDNLNKLQKDKKYIEIELKIHNFICEFLLDVTNKIKSIKTNRCTYLYHLRIILTNIKRWEKLRKSNIFFKDTIQMENIYFLISECLKQSIKVIEKKKYDDTVIFFFDDIDNIIRLKEFSTILDYAIDVESSNIYNLVSKHFDSISYLNKKYDISLKKYTSGKKIIKFFQNFL